MNASLRDVPLRDVPLRDVPLRDVPLRDVPLRDVPLRDARWSRGAAWCVVAGSALGACNVEPVTHDECHAQVTRAPGCPGAALVVMSDFVSTQVALTALDGRTLCPSFVSSARSDTTPVSYALSGDVSLPSERPPSGRVVVLDRYGTNVVSFLGAGGQLEAQLAVGTGFEANIQDYLEADATRAFVSRWGENPTPGREPLDGGGDLLVIDTKNPEILRSIALPREDDWLPRPAGMARAGDQAVVTLQRFSRDIKSQGDALLVGVNLEDEAVAWTLPLPGMKNCGTLTLAPDGAIAALACMSFVDRDGRADHPEDSGIVVLDLATSPPTELRRLPALELAGEPLQAELEFFARRRVLVKTQTALGGPTSNRVLAVDLEGPTDGAETVLEAQPKENGAGQGVVYGGVLCTPGCGDTCLVADADRGVLARFVIDGDALVAESSLAVTGSVGLPPRDIAGY